MLIANKKGTSKLISIIIATYNSEKYLQRCLDSIQIQKDKTTELIIIDNKSTDRTAEIITANDKIIDDYISEKDSGIYDAWNKGLKLAQGKWIMFIGSDDVLINGAVRFYHSLNLDTLQNDYIAPINEMIREDGEVVKTFGQEYDWKSFSKQMNIAHVGALHSANLFQQIGYFDSQYKVCGDYELLLRKSDKLNVLFVPQIVAKMQLGGVSQTKQALIETRRARKLHANPLGLVSEIKHYLLLLKYLLKGT